MSFTISLCSTNREQIAEAFMPTLRTLFIAPTTSPLAQIDVSNVAELLVHLTSDKHIANSSQTTRQIEKTTDDVGVCKSNVIRGTTTTFLRKFHALARPCLSTIFNTKMFVEPCFIKIFNIVLLRVVESCCVFCKLV